MDDLIYRGPLLRYIDRHIRQAKENPCSTLYRITWEIIRDYIEDDAPAVDATEVVRCKDCEHSGECMSSYSVWCDEFYRAVAKDGYCHFGVRKEVFHETD